MRRALIIGSLLLAAMAVVWFLTVLLQPRFDAEQKPQIGSGNPATMALAIRGEQIATITNTHALMSLLRGGRHVHPHRCTRKGKLSFYYEDGSEGGVWILPGHTNASYEFVCSNGYYSVPRAEFIAVLAAAGTDTNQIPLE